MSGYKVASFTGPICGENADVFDEKNRAFTICPYDCRAKASYEHACGW
jgi:hypothetical protein